MNDLDTMVNEYNSHFSVEQTDVLIPGDSGFDPTTMLEDEYRFCKGDSFCIAVPECQRYEWELYRLVTEPISGNKMNEAIDYRLSNDVIWNGGQFFIKRDNTFLDIGAYGIKLTVWDKNNLPYQDTATLYVTDRFSWE